MNVSLRFVFQWEMMLSSFIMKPTNEQTQENWLVSFIQHVNYILHISYTTVECGRTDWPEDPQSIN